METDAIPQRRAALHAALGDPIRLAIVDELTLSDRSPLELCRLVGIESNLLAHHLDVLAEVGLIERWRSSGDGRRRYVHLRRSALGRLVPGRPVAVGPALFLCSANSARSQLAAVAWQELTGTPADSAGTRPAERVHPGAVAAARRAGLDLSGAEPRAVETGGASAQLVITVCDRAHEELRNGGSGLHWSITDPVPIGTAAAFDATLTELRERTMALLDTAGVAS